MITNQAKTTDNLQHDNSSGPYSWSKTHKELVQYLAGKRSNQKELIELLKSVGIKGLHDENPKDNRIELEEIDPFSFFCYIYKHGSKKRLKILQEIAKKLDVAIPDGDSGIPSTQPLMVCMFPFKYHRTQNEIERLWNFFEHALNDSIDNEMFEDVLSIKGTGNAKLTEALFSIDPDKYLPINGPTKPYIKEALGINPKFKNYTEYMTILDGVKSKVDVPFFQLSHEAWKWNNERKKVNYWVFQGSPAVYDFKTAIKENLIVDWTVSSHRTKIKKGDKVIIWITGSDSGCYALAEITKEPHERGVSPDDHLFKKEVKREYKAGIKITHNLFNSPISKSQIDEVDELTLLKVGNQGTNFTATEEEYNAIMELVLEFGDQGPKYWLYSAGRNSDRWDDFNEDGIMGIGWDELGDLNEYKGKQEIENVLLQGVEEDGKRMPNNALACYEFRSVIQPGDIVIVKKGKYQYVGWGIVKSDYRFDDGRPAYKHVRDVDWKAKGEWDEVEGKTNAVKTLTDITKYPSYVERMNWLLGIDGSKPVNKSESMNYPLNTIFYGPPGTGKTYHTVDRALEICGKDLSNVERLEVNRLFDEKVKEGQIVFTTFHQSMSYEDFIEGIKPIEPEKDGDPVIYQIVEGIFRRVCIEAAFSIAKENETAETEQVLDFSLAYDHFAQQLEDRLASEESVKLATKNGGSVLVDNISPQGNILIRHVGGTRSYTVSKQRLSKLQKAIKDLDEVSNINNQFRDIIGGSNSSAYWAVLNAIRHDFQPTSSNGHETRTYTWAEKKEVVQAMGKEDFARKKGQQFVLIIDEINRGNVSQIFGELITLIEEDKRLGNEEALEVQLPYSKTPFGVPPNLYIIGTMNTADRSVEALDTALRRRFSFVEMPPDPQLITQVGPLAGSGGKLEGIDVVMLLATINRRIEKLIDKDHMIGHSYFLSIATLNDLKLVFHNKIIPLLQEYFFGDFGKIGLVLGQEFFEKQEENPGDDIFAEFDGYDPGALIERQVYHLRNVKQMSDGDFVKAIQVLLKIKDDQ